MAAEAAAPESGPISIDQAAGLLGAITPSLEQPETETPEADPPVAEPEEEETEDTEALTEPEADADPEAETADETEETEDAETDPPIPAPQSWSAADKAKFEALPRDVQETILARETDRDKAVQRSLQETADFKKAADTARAEAQGVTQIKAALEELAPRLLTTFASKWSNWTPDVKAKLSVENPAQYVALTAQFDREVGELRHLNDVKQQADDEAFKVFVRTETEKLATLAPELVDPKEGKDRRQALAHYLVREGVPADQVGLLDANTLRLARKAQLWDDAQAKAATAATPQPKPKAPAPKPLRPGAAQPAAPRQRTAEAALDRLSKTGTTDDAVRAMRALRQQKG